MSTTFLFGNFIRDISIINQVLQLDEIIIDIIYINYCYNIQISYDKTSRNNNKKYKINIIKIINNSDNYNAFKPDIKFKLKDYYYDYRIYTSLNNFNIDKINIIDINITSHSINYNSHDMNIIKSLCCKYLLN